MDSEKAGARIMEIIGRKDLARATTEHSYCAWLKGYCDHLIGLPSHVSSEQKLEVFLAAPAQTGCRGRQAKSSF